MIVHDCEQRTPEWFAARLGLPTASRFSDIITTKGAPSKSAEKYMTELLADWLACEPVDAVQATQWMERGTELEAGARSCYEMETGASVAQVGFITTDDRLAGCSPDGLVGDDGGLEIKCPKASTMVGYYERNESLVMAYLQQVQGSMWITGRKWWDLYAYHPALIPLCIRVDRDDTYIGKMEEAMQAFRDRLAERMAALEAAGWRVQ